METRDWADVFHRRVRAIGHDGAALHEFLPYVRALAGALFTQSGRNERSVRRAVHALHRCDDTKLREAWNVSGMEMLRVFNAPAKIFAAEVRLEGVLENVERFPVRAI